MASRQLHMCQSRPVYAVSLLLYRVEVGESHLVARPEMAAWLQLRTFIFPLELE